MVKQVMLGGLVVMAMVAAPGLLAQDAPSEPKAPTTPETPVEPETPSAPEAPTAPDAPTAPSAPDAPAKPDAPGETQKGGIPEEGYPDGKSPVGKRDMAFFDFSYRFHIEDGGPQPASFHDYRLGIGYGRSEGPDRGDWMLTYGRVIVHGRQHARRRGEMDAYGASFALGWAGLKSLTSIISEEASIDDERPYRALVPRVELELGVHHLDNFNIGQAPGSGLDNLNDRTGFRIGVLFEGRFLAFTWQYGYAREYYSSSGTVKDTTLLLKMELLRSVAASVGHRRLSVENFHRTSYIFGLEFGF